MQTVDLRGTTYDAFVAFLFERTVVPVPQDHRNEPAPWYWEVEAQFHPMAVASFYIRLFTNPGPPTETFTHEQLEQGFWAIQSGNLNCSVSELIWLPELPFEVRESVVRSMFHLFEKFFSVRPLDTSANMWWDSLAYDWHCGTRSRANGGEDLQMQEVMFDTLRRIACLQSPDVQYAALHGLGHLHHPDTPQFITEWLEQHADADLE